MRGSIARFAPLLVFASLAGAIGLILAVGAPDATGVGTDAPAAPEADIAAPPPANALTLFYIARRFSEIEPCGCVKNQLGGVQYEATIYAGTDRASSLRVDAGGWTAGNIAPDTSMRSRYALRAMGGTLDLDAVNVGRADLEHGATFFQDMGEKYPEALKPLVSANIYLKEKPDQRAFPPYKIVERQLPGGQKVRAAIAGLTALASPFHGAPHTRQPNSAGSYDIREPGAALKAVLPEMRQKSDLTIALVSATWAETVEIAKQNPELDVIVTGIEAPAQAKSAMEGKTLILTTFNSQGKELGRARLAAAAPGAWSLAGEPERIGVSPKLAANAEMTGLIADFKKSTSGLQTMRPANAARVYASARTCAGCHQAEYESWSKTAHSHALETLIAKGSQYDSKCLQCHTVGFQKDNGFYNAAQTPMLGGVQCENCHGPGLKHAEMENFIRNGSIGSLQGQAKENYLLDAKAAIPPKLVKAETCVQCHQGDNDPHFVYDEKIHKVNHSDVAKVAAAGGATAKPAPPTQPKAAPAAKPIAPAGPTRNAAPAAAPGPRPGAPVGIAPTNPAPPAAAPGPKKNY